MAVVWIFVVVPLDAFVGGGSTAAAACSIAGIETG
jgi:hypothetical protein